MTRRRDDRKRRRTVTGLDPAAELPPSLGPGYLDSLRRVITAVTTMNLFPEQDSRTIRASEGDVFTDSEGDLWVHNGEGLVLHLGQTRAPRPVDVVDNEFGPLVRLVKENTMQNNGQRLDYVGNAEADDTRVTDVSELRAMDGATAAVTAPELGAFSEGYSHGRESIALLGNLTVYDAPAQIVVRLRNEAGQWDPHIACLRNGCGWVGPLSLYVTTYLTELVAVAAEHVREEHTRR